MKWEKKVDNLLIGKHRREYVNVPTNVLRKAKAEKQSLVVTLKDVGLRYHIETSLLQMLLDNIEKQCVDSKKGKRGETVKEILNTIYTFKKDYEELVDGLYATTLACIKDEEKGSKK